MCEVLLMTLIATHAPPALLLNRPALVSAYTVLPLTARSCTGPARPVSIHVLPPSTLFWILAGNPMPAYTTAGDAWVTATAVTTGYCDTRLQLSPWSRDR